MNKTGMSLTLWGIYLAFANLAMLFYLVINFEMIVTKFLN